MPKQKIDKKDIVRKSLEVFKEKGYHKATMADLAAACGILKGSLYHHFSSKEHLMEEVLVVLREHYREKIFSLAYQDKIAPLTRLRTLASTSEEIFLQERGGCFMVSIGLETIHVVDHFTEIIRDFFNEWIKCLAHIYKEVYRPSVALETARSSVAEIEGAVMLMQIYNDPRYLKKTHKKLIKEFKLAQEQTKELI